MTVNKEKLIAELVNKGLDGDMDAVNACEDKMIRAKAKAMIVKVGKGTAERPPMPATTAVNNDYDDVPQDSSSTEINKNINYDIGIIATTSDKHLQDINKFLELCNIWLIEKPIVSIYNFNPQAENRNGQWVDLQPLGTEGQGTTAYPERKKYARTQIAIPFGGGIKYTLNERLNIMFSFSARKSLTD